MLNKGISVVINTLNEEVNIRACIESVFDIADEIVVCDMYSDDDTVKIANEFGSVIVFHEKTGYVEPARNFAISQAKYEWVLVLDADERMTVNLANMLVQQTFDDNFEVVTFWIRYWFFGDWVMNGGFFEGKKIRFFKKKAFLNDSLSIDENILHNGFMSLLRNPKQIHLGQDYYIDHYAYDTIEKYFSKTLGKCRKGWRCPQQKCTEVAKEVTCQN